ncbi:MAG: adenylate cyclase [Nocardioidaceae bacterium]|jgi:class 3 adenylate cyclase|nr:adenylate cyclase [Nocardioidaceae bacterium]
MNGAVSAARRGPLSRFDTVVETEYRAWFEQRFAPLAAALTLISALCWIANAPLASQFADSDKVVLVYIVCWGVNLPALVISTWYLRRPEPRRAVAVAFALLVLTTLDMTSVIMPTVPDLDPIAYAVAAIFFGLLAPLIQLPFRATVVFAVLVTAVGVVGTLRASGAGEVANSTLTFALGLTVVSISLVGPALAFTNERDLRVRFLDEMTIAHQRTLIRRYAPSSVVSRIEHGDTTVDHPQRRKVTVFFSDVVGFTALADRVDPEALADIVNDYLGELSELIERHGGTLNEFAGDGVMAIFGAPDELEPADQVLRALAAAQELQHSLPTWSRSWYQHGIIEDAQARVGINTGTVSVGTFGSKIRATYTGIGLQTNIAARVQAEAPPGGILLSNTSWHLVNDTVTCQPRGEVMVKGVHFPIGLYSPL